ncbi:MAG: hypothetical protein R6T87_06990 [Marinobacter sp.]
MGVKFSELKGKGLFKVRIYLSEAFPEAMKEYRKMYEDAYIEMREPTAAEATLLQEGGAEGAAAAVLNKLSDCLLSHNFIEDDGRPAKKDQVVELIVESSTIATYVMQTWVNSLPLAQRKSGNSEKPQSA